jgi:hypothetical protein
MLSFQSLFVQMVKSLIDQTAEANTVVLEERGDCITLTLADVVLLSS